jgi:ssRNA-specific RNase YbeY (16S rRNA maturation enzyme)
MIHGVLHLCGYKDKKKEDQVVMRKKENAALRLFDKEFSSAS